MANAVPGRHIRFLVVFLQIVSLPVLCWKRNIEGTTRLARKRLPKFEWWNRTEKAPDLAAC
jgi:hypothetical protein